MNNPPREPNLTEVVGQHLRQIAAAVRRAKEEKTFSLVIDVEGLQVAVRAGRPKVKRCSELPADLPVTLAGKSKATRRVYLFLRDARTRPGGDSQELWQQDICDAIEVATPKNPVAIRTVHRVIKELCKLNLIHRDDDLGYVLGGQQPTLPF